ncbi:hypothetical protein AAG906_005202 [Vitis piasezkii]
MSKTITASDTKKGQSRLLIPKEKGLWDQLWEEEQMELRRRGYVEVEVCALPCVEFWMEQPCEDNNLEAGVDCMLWSFRMGSKLCFALGVERQNNP